MLRPALVGGTNMGDDYTPVLTPEEEEEERRRQQGPGADFPGVVLPNPLGLTPHLDTDSGIEPTRLSDGAKLSLPRSGESPHMDISNPPMNQMGAPAMREVSSSTPAVGSTADLESHIGGRLRPADHQT